VHHSQGIIKAGELCFFVFASSAHRQTAREAVAYVTDEVKKRLPIFGKEILEDGAHTWKKNA
jgi:molybdopterin synthase catalytic subunit